MKTAFLLLLIYFLCIPPLLAEENAGKELFTLRCGGACHQLPEPGMLKPKQWEKVLKVMQERMKQKGYEPLPEEEYKAILAYLVENARR